LRAYSLNLLLNNFPPQLPVCVLYAMGGFFFNEKYTQLVLPKNGIEEIVIKNSL